MKKKPKLLSPVKTFKTLRESPHLSRTRMLVVVVAFAVIGSVFLIISHAATPFASVQPEGSTINSPAIAGNDPNASGGSYVQFKAGGSVGGGQGVFGGTWDGVAKSSLFAIVPGYNRNGEFFTEVSNSAAEHRNFYITHADGSSGPPQPMIDAVHNSGGKIFFYVNPSEFSTDCNGGGGGTSNFVSGDEAIANGWALCSQPTSYGVLADVNNANYRTLFVQRAMAELDARGWDGVNMDNLWPAQQFQSGNLALIKLCVAEAHKRGKVCGGNLTDQTDQVGIDWGNSLAGVADFLDYEHFGSWGIGINTGRTVAMLGVAENLTAAGTGINLFGNVHADQPPSTALAIFGASMLVANKNTRYQVDDVTDGVVNGSYIHQWHFSEMDKNYGQPLENRVTLATNTFRRRFQNGTVYVNLDGADHTVDGVYVAAYTAVFK